MWILGLKGLTLFKLGFLGVNPREDRFQGNVFTCTHSACLTFLRIKKCQEI